MAEPTPEGMIVDENGKPTGASIFTDEDPEVDARWRENVRGLIPRVLWDPEYQKQMAEKEKRKKWGRKK